MCSDYLCDFAATGFVLGAVGDPGSGGAYCERCGRKMIAEHCKKIEPGWRFQPGKIDGDLASLPVGKDDCAFLSYVVDRLTS